jgi:hypothetical protein
MGPWIVRIFYVLQDATLHNLFYLETALHVSGGTTTHHQEWKQLNFRYYVPVFLWLLLVSWEWLTLILLMWSIGWAPNSIPIYLYIQKDATLHSLFISGNCSTCFGWYFHPSSGAQTTVSIASGICQTVTAICRYHERVGTGLSVLWVAYATHSTLKPVPTLPR